MDVASMATVGWFPRERFELAAESLQTLLDHTPPCRLAIVDPATPPRYLGQIEAVLGDRPVEVIRTGKPVLPAVAKNLILDGVGTDYVALVENDVLFTPGWLEGLLAACEEFPADVAAPVIFDGRQHKEHFDKHLGHIEPSVETPGRYEIVPLASRRNEGRGRQQVQFVEQHCLVFRTAAFDRIGRFDEELNTRDEVDLSCALWKAGCTIVLDPSVGIHYVPPSWRPDDDELPFYRHRWDVARAEASRHIIRDRWDLVETPGDLGFVRYRNLIASLPEVRRALEALAVSGPTVLVDDGDWFGTEVTEQLTLRPFPERHGVYQGFPATDADAVGALDRAIEHGARFIVVGFPAFWWFDHLPGLRNRLTARCRLRRDDDLLQIYEVAS